MLARVQSVAAAGGSAALALINDASGDTSTLNVIWANSAALELLGLTTDEVIGADLQPDDVLNDDGRPHWTTVIHGLVDSGPAITDEWTDAVVEGPGRTLWPVQVKAAAAGAGRFVVWLRSVSEGQRLAEAAAHESEHRFRSLAEHAPVGIIVSEAGIRLGFVNARFAEITGVAEPALMGISWLKTVHPEDLPILLSTLDEVLAGEPREANVRVLGNPGAGLATSSPIAAAAAGPPSTPSVRDFDTGARWVQIRLSPVTTPRRSAGFIGTVEDVTDRRAWEKQLSYFAGHDALTGLANRRSLVESMTQLLSSRRTRDRDAAVLFCDLDGFKQINDTLGHEAGDRVLIEVAQRLSTTARDHDLVARIAGDEFVVLIREIGSYHDAEAAASRQLAALKSPIVVAGTSVVVSASIGVAMARDYESAAELLRAADRGMYEAKRAGRGRFQRTSPGPSDSAGGTDDRNRETGGYR
jgi:diguanylate cyclase (GGDEF)-like protein